MNRKENTTKANTWAEKINVITLFANDLPATKAFYQTVFGSTLVFEDENSAVFDFGNLLINLLITSAAPELIEPAKVASPEAGSHFVITIRVDNVDAICQHIQSLGISLLNGPMDRPWGIRTASFKDPAGYIWELADG